MLMVSQAYYLYVEAKGDNLTVIGLLELCLQTYIISAIQDKIMLGLLARIFCVQRTAYSKP
jgi:hypothetical protein